MVPGKIEIGKLLIDAYERLTGSRSLEDMFTDLRHIVGFEGYDQQVMDDALAASEQHYKEDISPGP